MALDWNQKFWLAMTCLYWVLSSGFPLAQRLRLECRSIFGEFERVRLEFSCYSTCKGRLLARFMVHPFASPPRAAYRTSARGRSLPPSMAADFRDLLSD